MHFCMRILWEHELSFRRIHRCDLRMTMRHERREGRKGLEVCTCLIDEGKAPRNRLTGAGSKPPSAAVVKSHGCEHRRKRPGKNRVR
jgi:hypothetical protein